MQPIPGLAKTAEVQEFRIVGVLSLLHTPLQRQGKGVGRESGGE